MSATDTPTRLLDTAQALIQERGYNAFSYKDLAAAVGIRTASIHYHFPSKADLGLALMGRYQEQLEQALGAIDQKGRSAKGKLKAFIQMYRDTASQGAICLCGSLATDRETLPETLQEAVAAYLDRSEAWVAERVAAGVKEGEFDYGGKPADAAASLVSSLQGGLILARATHGTQRLESLQRVFLTTLGSA